jgi:hypothetical protein
VSESERVTASVIIIEKKSASNIKFLWLKLLKAGATLSLLPAARPYPVSHTKVTARVIIIVKKSFLSCFHASQRSENERVRVQVRVRVSVRVR